MTKKQEKFLQSVYKEIEIIQKDVMNLLYCESRWQENIKPFIEKQNKQFCSEISRSHYQSTLTAIRKQVSKTDGDVCLLNLLNKLKNSNKWITEQWYVENWLKDSDFVSQSQDLIDFTKQIPVSEFRRIFGKDGYLDEQIIQEDIQKLIDVCKRIKKYTNENITHTKKVKKEKLVSFEEYKLAIKTIDDITTKYVLLLEQIGITLTPVAQF